MSCERCNQTATDTIVLESRVLLTYIRPAESALAVQPYWLGLETLLEIFNIEASFSGGVRPSPHSEDTPNSIPGRTFLAVAILLTVPSRSLACTRPKYSLVPAVNLRPVNGAK
jgi:hypothetical protein